MESQRQSFGWKCSTRFIVLAGFPGGTSGKEPACQCRRHKRHGFDPWVGKIPWRRRWQPTLISLPRESPWTEELMGYFHGVTKSLKRLSIHTDCFARQRGTQQIFASEKLCLNLRVFNEEFIAIRLFNRRFLRVAQTVKHL